MIFCSRLPCYVFCICMLTTNDTIRDRGVVPQCTLHHKYTMYLKHKNGRMVGCKQRGVRATFQAHVDNFLVKLWNLVKIVKSGQNDQNCEIWLELLNLVQILKLRQNCETLQQCEIVKLGPNCEIWSKLWNDFKDFKSGPNCEIIQSLTTPASLRTV